MSPALRGFSIAILAAAGILILPAFLARAASHKALPRGGLFLLKAGPAVQELQGVARNSAPGASLAPDLKGFHLPDPAAVPVALGEAPNIPAGVATPPAESVLEPSVPGTLIESGRRLEEDLRLKAGDPAPLDKAFDASASDSWENPSVPGGGGDSGDPLRSLYLSIAQSSPATLKSLDRAQRQALWRAAFRHKVAGIDYDEKLAKYDPTGIIGFCFGRAMAVHLLARKTGLAEENIRKLFVIGDLRSGPNPEWRFHVTTLVKGEDGHWHAIDPILRGPMRAESWVSMVQSVWDRGRKARFYAVPASTVIPDLSLATEPAQEKGDRIIELSFDPSTRAGFTLSPLGEPVFEVSPRVALQFFKDAQENVGFDFAGVTINGERISYNGYFADLLGEIENPSSALASIPGAKPASGTSSMRALGADGETEILWETSEPRPLGLHIGRLKAPRTTP
jgi:hypothetical protein